MSACADTLDDGVPRTLFLAIAILALVMVVLDAAAGNICGSFLSIAWAGLFLCLAYWNRLVDRIGVARAHSLRWASVTFVVAAGVLKLLHRMHLVG